MINYFTKGNKKQTGKIAKIFVSSVLAFALFLSNFNFSTAAINKQINYQGKLTNSSGVAVADGTYNMEFKLYNSVPAVVWTETRTNANRVQVTNGLFSVMLGSVSSLSAVDFNQTLTLGVNIGGTAVTPTWDGEMSPRKTLGSVPAAFVAETVTGAAQTNITSLGTLTGLTVTGATTLRGLTVDNATSTYDRIAVTPASLGAARFDGTITNADLTAARTWTLPNADGTIALTSNLPVAANPTATIGLVGVNGTASTFMRSDAAPALSQAITPTWTGAHIFSNSLTANGVFTLGDNGDAGSINTNDWDISTTGALTGISGITTDGGYTQSGSATNYFTGKISGTGSNLLTSLVVDTHPESSTVTLPFINNDIAYLTQRGGSVIANYGTPSSALFNGAPDYAYYTTSDLTTNVPGGYVLEITFHKTFYYGAKIGISFGSAGWRAKSIMVETYDPVTTTWTTKGNVTNYADQIYQVEGATIGANGISKVRFTFNDYASTGFRISEIWLLNYNSLGPKEVFVARDGSTMYGGIDMNTNILTNIGNAGTDFVASTGALNLAGVLTSNGGISNPSSYTQSGANANTFTGTSTFSNATYSALFTGGSVGIGTTSPTAVLHLKAGTATANTAPLKFTSGTNLTTAETGAMEYDGTNLYFTPTGTTRKTIAYTSDIAAQVYPGTGVAVSTGSAWGTSLTVGTGANNLVQLNASSQLPAVSGANLTSLTAGNLSGTIPSAVLGNSTHYIGTTAITLNRASAAQALTGITSIDGSAATLTTSRAINGVGFNGSAAITIPVNSTDDTTTNASVYPLWTTATGNTAAKISTTKLSFNPSTGILTATGFAGTITGTASKATNLVGGNSTTLLGSMPYQSGTDTTTMLPPNTSAAKMFLTQTGTGTNGAAPAWGSIINSDIPAALTGKTYNALTLTSNATGFAIAGGTTSKTLTISNTLTLAGTDGSTMTFPSTSATIARTDTGQTFAGTQNFDSNTLYIDSTNHTVGIGTNSVTTHKVKILGSVQIGDGFSYTPTVTTDLTVGSATQTSRFLFGQSNTAYGGMQWNYSATPTAGYMAIGLMNGDGNKGFTVFQNGNIGVGHNNPTALLHLKAGTATANTAPLKFTAGTNLTTAEAGAMEYDGTNLYFTPTGTTRKTIAYTSDIAAQVYPGTGVAVSTGSAWGTSLTVGTGANNLVQLNASSQLPVVSGVNLTNLTAGNLTGTIPSAVLGNSTHYIGTTAITLNRASASQSLTGITSIDGYSAAVTLTADNTTNATNYPLFVNAATGNLSPRTDTGFTYNPSTGMLTSTGFTGALTGNASTATTLQTSRTINGIGFNGSANITVPVNSTDDTTTNASVYPLWTTAAGNTAAKISTTKLSFNPSTGTLTSTKFATSGGTSSQFLKGDGSLDSNTYLTSASLSGYVPYTGATGAVTLGANTLSTTSGLITPKLYPSANSTTAIQFNKADGTTNVMNIDTTNGYVGIGTTSPGSLLEVNQSADAVTAFRVYAPFSGGGSSAALIDIKTDTARGFLTAYPSASGSGSTYRGNIELSASGTSQLLLSTNNNERMRINTNGKILMGATSDSSDAKLYISGSSSSNGSSTGIAGILGNYTVSNGGNANYVEVGNRFVITNSPTTNPNTAAGEIIRMVDNTSLANTVRGLEVTANGGSNTAGVNTGIRGNGATFGIQGVTNALGGGVSVPAAIYGESTGTTQGDVLRLYSSTVTSANSFATFYHSTSTFSGTGLLMDFASGSGSFTGDFMNLKKNGTSLFKVTNTGVTSLGLSSTAATSAVCSSLANGTAPTSGVSYELRDCSGSPVADYAEMYPVESDVEYGDIVVTGSEIVSTYDLDSTGNIDWNKVKGNVSRLVKSNTLGQSNVIGIVSDNHGDFSSTGYNIKESDNPMPIALSGRVPVKIANSSSPIKAGDYLTTSVEGGRATRALKSGFVIGKALEDWTPDSGKDMIMVFVEQGYYTGEETTFAGLTFFEGDAEFVKNVKFDSTVEFALPPLFNNDTAGFAVIKPGAKRVDVKFTNPYIATPVVNATITFEKGSTPFDTDSFFNNDLKYIVVDKDENGFTIAINNTATEDVRFSWTALAVKDPKVFESVIDGLVIDSPAVPSTYIATPTDGGVGSTVAPTDSSTITPTTEVVTAGTTSPTPSDLTASVIGSQETTPSTPAPTPTDTSSSTPSTTTSVDTSGTTTAAPSVDTSASGSPAPTTTTP